MYIRVFIPILFLFVVGCSSTENTKHGVLAPEIYSKFELQGHIEESNIRFPKNIETPVPKTSSPQSTNIKPKIELPELLYSVSAVNVPVSEILYELAVSSGKGLSLHSDVVGKITINAINQPLSNILTSLVDQVSAHYIISKYQITVKPISPYWEIYQVNYVNLKKKSTDSIVLNMSIGGDEVSRSESTGSKVEMVSEHDFWGSLEKSLSAMSFVERREVTENNKEAGDSFQSLVVNKEAGLVSVYTTSNRHLLIENYLSEVIKRSSKQVLIEATVVEVELFDEYQAGINWQAVSGDITVFQNVIGASLSAPPNFNINISEGFNLRALQRFGDTKVLSSPRIMAINNQTALLKVVNNEVYFTAEVTRETSKEGASPVTTFETTVHTVPVGFVMSLTPFITENKKVLLSIRPTLSRVVEYKLDPNPILKEEGIESRIPVIQEREMSTVLILRNRQTAVIGGLIQDTHSNIREGIPGLSMIPIIGDLFTYREDRAKKSELVIFIRPIIIENPDINHGDLISLQPFLKTNSMSVGK